MFDHKAYYEKNKEKLINRAKARYQDNKEEKKAYDKAYREANKERIIALKKAYYEENKEKIKAGRIPYREANRDRERARAKAWAKANKEKVKAYREANKEKRNALHKAYYEANKERLLAQQNDYKKANKDKVYAYIGKRRASKLNRTPSWLSKEDLAKIKDIYRMAKRRSEVEGILYHVDHIIPLQGKNISGLHVPNNLQILKATENLSKGNKHG